jgi:hypothetical protein
MIKSVCLLGSAALLLTTMLVGDAHAAAKKDCKVLCKTELASCVTEAKARTTPIASWWTSPSSAAPASRRGSTWASH